MHATLTLTLAWEEACHNDLHKEIDDLGAYVAERDAMSVCRRHGCRLGDLVDVCSGRVAMRSCVQEAGWVGLWVCAVDGWP